MKKPPGKGVALPILVLLVLALLLPAPAGAEVIKRRETIEDLFAHESLLP